MARRERAKFNIPMVIALVLLCLTLFSLHFTSDIYARYVSKAEGSDNSRVAEFNITEETDFIEADMLFEFVPGVNKKTIVVNNESEVAVEYKVTIVNKTGNIPFVFKIGEDENPEDALESPAKFAIEANSVKNYNVFLIWESANASDYMGMVDLITINLEAVQKD